MRLARMLGSAAAVAMVAMVFVGSGTASANSSGPVWCKQVQFLCVQTNVIGPGRLFAAGITRVTLLWGARALSPVLSGVLSEKCEESEISGEWDGKESGKINPIGSIVGLTFSKNCTPCTTITTKKLPAKSELAATSEGKGTLTGAFEAVLSGCPLGVTCTFKTEKSTLEIIGAEKGGEIKAAEVSLTFVEGSKAFCGTTAKWTASYAVNRVVVDLWEGALLKEEDGINGVSVSPQYGI